LPYEKIRYEVAEDGVATVTLDSPENRNALSREMIGELLDSFSAARDDDTVRCVVLTSSHERVFSSGANLAGFAEELPLVHRHFGSGELMRVFRLICELGKPTICAANGHVLAGALGLALACDLVIAKEGAEFGTPEINVGTFPFMLLGERIGAEEARAAGIVNKVVAPEEFDAAVREWASGLAAKSPALMRLGKEAMYRQQDMGFLDALDYLRAQLSLALSTEDIQEGVKAFFEKREPQWTGR
jgi:enoyl-CoA hydratase